MPTQSASQTPISQLPSSFASSTQLAENREWGTASRIFLDDHTEAVLVEIAADWHSSIHLHRHKSNEFVVLSGELRIVWWPENFPRLSRRLNSSSGPLTIGDGIKHAFYSLTDVVAIEIYRAASGATIDVNDIVRFSERGHGKLPI